jgi:two-component system chemotaxis sensor kinase CheA
MASEQDDLWRTYSMDANDALRDVEESLLSLEGRSDDASEINRLYRALHTLKGNSAVMGMTSIESLAHAAEDMVGLVRDQRAPVGHDMIELMLQLIDRLTMLTGRAAIEQRDCADLEVRDLIERVHAWTMQHGGVIKETSSVGRGELVVWSSMLPRSFNAPEPGQVLVEDQETVEIFLGLARETLDVLFAALAPAEAHAVATAMPAACADLLAAAQTAGYDDVASILSSLSATDEHGDRAQLHEQLADLCAALDGVERRYQKCAEFPQSFGMSAAHEQAVRAAKVPTEAAARLVAARASLRAPPPQRAPAEHIASEPGSKNDVLRIDAKKVSLIMDLTAEVALACGAVTHHPELEGSTLEGFTAAAHKLEVLIRELQTEVSAMRLVPVAGVFQRMRRVVRDTAKRTGKKVELTLVGEDTEIDKVMVDCLQDPLVHLLRNAIDHGIELPEDRRRAGKPETGQIVLEASHQGGEVSVRVSDDGGGLDRKRLRKRAEERSLIEPDRRLSDAQILDLIFLPGFSTKEKVDSLSGRGVGMDVVKTTIEGLHGRVQLESTEGRGSNFNMTVPLTLAFVEAMVVSDAGRLFALPIEKVFEVFKAEPHQLSTNSADGVSLVRVRDQLVPVLWLHRFYGEDTRSDERLEGRVIVVVQTSRGTLALPVDALHGNQPVMLKPLRGVLASVRAAAGCGMLRTGDVALAIDCEQLYA